MFGKYLLSHEFFISCPQKLVSGINAILQVTTQYQDSDTGSRTCVCVWRMSTRQSRLVAEQALKPRQVAEEGRRAGEEPLRCSVLSGIVKCSALGLRLLVQCSRKANKGPSYSRTLCCPLMPGGPWET